MTWKDLTLKERASIYKQARAISPDLTYFDIRDIMDQGYEQWFSKLQQQRGEMAQDYDYRKFYSRNRNDAEAMLTGGPSAHFTDQYKLPNHPTFSNESIYNTKSTPGGSWIEHPNDKWEFQHSDFTMGHSDETLRYLKTNDPNVVSTYKGGVVLPEIIVTENKKVPTYSNGGTTKEPVEATFGLPEVNIYPQNEFGDIARSQGINTARNWRTVKEGTTKGINDFYNDPRTQMVMAGLPMPSLLNVADDGVKLVKAAVDGSKVTKKIKGLYYNNAPWTFKPNPNSYYRAIPREAIDDALTSGVIRGNPNPGPTPAEIANMSLLDKIKNAGSRAFADQTYFTKGVPLSSNYGDRYNKVVSNYGTHLIEASEDVPFIPVKTKGRVPKDILDNLDKNYNPEIRGVAMPKANVLPEKTVPVTEHINLYEPNWFFGFKKIK